MAIRIPIISDFDTGGIEKAVNQFKKLETNAERTSFLIKKSFIPATAALAGLAVAGFSAAKAAAEDQAQQALLANQLKNTTGATNAQIVANEKFVSTLSMTAAVADDELRPALSNLVRGTGDLAKAQDLLKISLDVASGTGKSLSEVTDAVSKAYGGNTKAIKQLSPELFKLVKDGASADQVMQALSKTFGGSAAASANSAEGQFRKFGIAMNELKESIGVVLLPIVTKFIGFLTDLANWAGKNAPLIVGIGTAIATIATAIIAVNIAFKAYRAVQLVTIGVNYALAASFTAVEIATGIGIVAVVAGIAAFALYKRQMNGLKDSLGAFNDESQQSNQQLIRMSDAGKLASDSTADLTLKTGGAGGAVDAMTQKIKDARAEIKDNFTTALDDANSKLEESKKAYDDFRSSVSQSLTGELSVSGAADAAKEAGTTILEQLNNQANAAKMFGEKVRTLLGMGISKEALSQVLQAGVDAGTAIADELIKGGSDAITGPNGINTMVESLNTLAQSVGILAADQFYMAGVEQGKAMVAGITSVVGKYEKLLKNPKLKLADLKGLMASFDAEISPYKLATPSLDFQVPPSPAAGTGTGGDQYSISVDGGLSSSSEIGQAVVNAIRAFNRTNGPAQIAISGY
jgi:hypothetical protein